jgi:hypothetical protein
MKKMANEKMNAKAKMCWLMLAITLLAFPNTNFGQTVNLGILESFEGYTGAGAITNGDGATWTGDAGTNIGIISGFGAPPFFNGNTYNANAVTAQCRFDLFKLYIHLNDLFVDYPATHAPAFGAGETITPGVYSIPAAGSIGAALTLDGGGDPNAFFVIKFYGAMTVGAGAVVNLTGGTQSCNVFYIANGAISVAASADIKGTLFAKLGAIGLGAGAVLEGRMLSLEGALVTGVGATVSLPPGSCTIPVFCENNCSPAPAVDILGVLSNYALYTYVGAVPNTSTSGINGNIGTNAGIISGFATSVVIGDIHNADASTAQANIDIDNAYISLMALPNTVLAHAAAFGSVAPEGDTINAGVYFINSAGSLGGTLVLDGQNDFNAIFVFKFAGAFSVVAQAKMILINGARRCNVFFIGGAGVATGAISIGAGATLKGTFLSHGGACDSGADLFLAGRQLSTGGAVGTYSGIIYNNPECIHSTTLPIELLSFTVEYHNQNIVFEWSTASEISNEFFTIERSINGMEWQEIYRVAGAGNSSSLLVYSTTDKHPYMGVSYYRLKQTDFDGKFKFSEIRYINIENMNSTIEIYPNPTSDKITIIGDDVELENIKLYNIVGQGVISHTVIMKHSKNKFIIDLTNLKSGFYYLKTKTTANRVYKE